MLYNMSYTFKYYTHYIKYCALDIVCTISNTASLFDTMCHTRYCFLDIVHYIKYCILDSVHYIVSYKILDTAISNHIYIYYIIYHVYYAIYKILCLLNLLFIYYALYTIKYRHKVNVMFHFQKILHKNCNNWRITKLISNYIT